MCELMLEGQVGEAAVRVVGGGLASMMLLAAAAARVSGRARCLQ
jgi:hypothetical protein